MLNHARTTCVLLGAALAILTGSAVAGPAFQPDGKGGYAFDTGALRGTLGAGGKSRGLSSVTYVPTGARLDRGAGICSFYRIFTTNKRYGKAAWDWPSTSKLLPDGAVQITWPAAEDRPFEMVAVYRWTRETALDVETTVKAKEDLSEFEVFLASYFDEAFASPYVFVKANPDNEGKAGFMLAKKSHGDWLMFPRAQTFVPIIRDGRWEKEPHPVNWTIMPTMAAPVCFRGGSGSMPTVILMAPAGDCFAMSAPYEGESHYSLYVSLFGRDLKAGESTTARTRLVVATTDSDAGILGLYRQYAQDRARRK
jgi:hypothetical protein